MKPFIDLVGASGAVYRFRRFDQGPIPATGGSFAYVREEEGASRVVGFGKARTLALALAGPIGRREPGADLYMRLNVVAAHQDTEFEDLVAALPQPLNLYEAE